MAGRVRGALGFVLLGLATVGCEDAIFDILSAWDASGLGGQCRTVWSWTTMVSCTRDENECSEDCWPTFMCREMDATNETRQSDNIKRPPISPSHLRR